MCGIWRESLQQDHIYPKWKCDRDGWTKEQKEDPSNIQYICANCHQDKSAIDRIGRIADKKTRALLSLSLLGNKRARSLSGRVVSIETRNKISASLKGRIASQQTKAKLSFANLFFIDRPKASEETRHQMSDSQSKRRLEEIRTKSSFRNDNKSGIPGVHYQKASGKWIVRLSLGNVRKYIGCYPTLEEATVARIKAVEESINESAPRS